MKKILPALLSTAVILFSSTGLYSISNISNNNILNNQSGSKNSITNIKNAYVNKSPMISYNVNDQNQNTNFRLYIDSSGDTLSYAPNAIDLSTPKAGRNQWVFKYYNFMQLEISDYANSKDEFLSIIKNLNISYSEAYNTWNGQKGWSNSAGKNAPFEDHEYNFQLDGNNQNVNLDHYSDPHHSNKEAIDLGIVTNWDDNKGTVTFSFQLGVWYTWSSGSTWNHASLLEIRLNNLFCKGSGQETQLVTKNNFHPITGVYSAVLGLGATIDIEDLFKDAVDLYKDAKKNNYSHWGVNYFAELVNGFGTGKSPAGVWASYMIQSCLNNPYILAELNLVAHSGISSGIHKIELDNILVNEFQEQTKISYYNGVFHKVIITTSPTLYIPEAIDPFFGCSTSITTYTSNN